MQLSFKKNKLRAFFKFFNLKVSILLIKKYLDFRKYKPTKIYRYSNYIKNTSSYWNMSAIHFLGCVGHAVILVYIIPICLIIL